MEIVSTYGGEWTAYGSIAGYISSGSANDATSIKSAKLFSSRDLILIWKMQMQHQLE